MDLKEFNLKRKQIIECYSKILEISLGAKNESLTNIIKQSVKSLKEDKFNMVIVGEFSRGKSTFINALLGQRILPSATKPTTTIINKISYGEKSEFNLHFRENDNVKTISEKEFKYITAKLEPNYDDEDEVKEYNENLKLVSSISYADIKYPTNICKEGIEIIDTPGTNDLDQAREEITFKFIPKSDIAMLILSANQILSKSEINFLKERILENDIKKVFFVINFKDRLSSIEDEQKVISYAKEHLKKVVDNPKIFMVSSKQALNFKRKLNGEIFKGIVPNTLEETGFNKMEKHIKEYLINEKGTIKLKKYVDRGIKSANYLIKNIITKLNTVNLSVDELEKGLKKAIPYFKNTERNCLEIINEFKISLVNLEDELVNQYRNGLELIAAQANLVVNNYEGDLEIELIARRIEEVVAPLQKNLQKELEVYKKKFIDIEINKYVTKVQKILEDISFNFTNSLMVVENNNNKNSIYINEVENEELNEANLLSGLMAGGLIVAFLHIPFIAIPAAIFGGKYFLNSINGKRRQDFLTNIKMQVDKRYGEIIPIQIKEFRKKYEKNIEYIVSQLEDEVYCKIRELKNQVQDLIDEKNKKQLIVEKEISKLNNWKDELNLIKNTLSEVL